MSLSAPSHRHVAIQLSYRVPSRAVFRSEHVAPPVRSAISSVSLIAIAGFSRFVRGGLESRKSAGGTRQHRPDRDLAVPHPIALACARASSRHVRDIGTASDGAHAIRAQRRPRLRSSARNRCRGESSRPRGTLFSSTSRDAEREARDPLGLGLQPRCDHTAVRARRRGSPTNASASSNKATGA